jgi:hypothetical protein
MKQSRIWLAELSSRNPIRPFPDCQRHTYT